VHYTWRVSLKRIPTRRGGVSVRAETISPPSDIGFRWQMRFHGSRGARRAGSHGTTLSWEGIWQRNAVEDGGARGATGNRRGDSARRVCSL
jgi:hypothetical protein